MLIDSIQFDDEIDLVDYMFENLEDGYETNVFVPYEKAIDILDELLKREETHIENIYITDDLIEYNKEYLIVLDNEYGIWCQKAYYDNYGYSIKYMIDDKVLIHGDCNCLIQKDIKCDELLEFEYEDELEECDDVKYEVSDIYQNIDDMYEVATRLYINNELVSNQTFASQCPDCVEEVRKEMINSIK